MPGKGRGRGARDGADDAEHKEKGRSKFFKLPDLRDDNFDAWERKLKHVFYSEGWTPMHKESLHTEGKASEDDFPADGESRRAAWGTITSSLDGQMTAQARWIVVPRPFAPGSCLKL